MRNTLPNRRYSMTFDLSFEGIWYTCSFGYYMDGTLGEVFLHMSKVTGTTMDICARDIAVLISLGIQHGVALETMYNATIKKADGSPDGLAGYVLGLMIENVEQLKQQIEQEQQDETND